MKTCTRCKNDFEIEEFKVINQKTQKRTSLCKTCKKEYDNEYYANNKHKLNKNENAQNIRNRNLQYSVDYLKANPCCDCGEKDFIVLEFDHKENKTLNVSDMVRLCFSLEKIKEEISKCDVVCRNCHKRRTAKQFGYYKNIDV